MPIREETVKRAACDVCGEKAASSCAVCGGVFCSEHSTHFQIKSAFTGVAAYRILCKKCIDTATPKAMIEGHCPMAWEGGRKESADTLSQLLLEADIETA